MSSPGQPRDTDGPPRLVAALLRMSVRDPAACEGLLGDLQEEYTRLTQRGALANRFRNLSTTMGHSTGLIREQCPVW